MERIKEEFNRYKWILLAGIMVSVLIALITANFHVIKFVGYKLKGDEQGIIKVLEQNIKSNSAQTEWYFESGMTELLKSNTWSEDVYNFMDENYIYFSDEYKFEVIDGYNKKRQFLTMNKDVMDSLVSMMDNKIIQDYIKRMEPKALEQGLILMYGNNPEVTDEFVDNLYDILSIYPDKIPFEEFTFELSDILILEGEENNLKKLVIFEGINPDQAREPVMNSIKNKSLTGEQLNEWVEFLNNTQIIDNVTYTNFNNLYSEIFVVRDQYKQLDLRQIDLENQKEAIELQIGQSLVDLENKQKEMGKIDKQISDLDSELGSVTDYAYMALYLEKATGTGTNEYEASIPRKGLFGSYKPSGQKYIVALTDTGLVTEGVYYLDIYIKGTKLNAAGNEYPYYVVFIYQILLLLT